MILASVLGADASIDAVPEGLIGDWLGDLSRLPLDLPVGKYVAQQAALLSVGGEPDYGAVRASFQPHHRVLELPGCGGRLAAHVVGAQPEIAASRETKKKTPPSSGSRS